MNTSPFLPALSNDILSSPFLLENVGAPFVIGLGVGYFAKKMLRLALLLTGAAVVLLFAAEYFGSIKISDTVLVGNINEAQNFGSFLLERLSHISGKGGSSVAGFFVGLKMS